jgi:anaerobic magnesium-protoporphyrin IX monomethyl ester cyclase
MVFCGAESGSNEVLEKMNKGITTEQIMMTAAKTREHGIIPEFSFVFGDPDEPELQLENTFAFIRKLKAVNPAMELISYFYTPTPQRQGTYGDVDAHDGVPETLEEWIKPEWVAWMTHENPRLPWFEQKLRARAEDFELVLKSRFPSVHDRQTRGWGKLLGQAAAWRRWEQGNFDDPQLLRRIRKLARVVPDDTQAYGHLRPIGSQKALRRLGQPPHWLTLPLMRRQARSS